MVSTTDFEKLLFFYKTEGKNRSIQTFCMNNVANYRTFDKCIVIPQGHRFGSGCKWSGSGES